MKIRELFLHEDNRGQKKGGTQLPALNIYET